MGIAGVGGYECHDNCKVFTADFPSSSPYIVSTGATQFEGSAAKGTEVATDWSSGGFSNFFPRPAYQEKAVSQFLGQTKTPKKFFNQTGRGFPDVSAIGLGFQVMVNGSLMSVGGTSASTPVFASVVSLLNDIRLSNGLPTMGHINPFLYEAFETSKGAFTDILKGHNQYGCCTSGFEAMEGWDPITGIGTPVFQVLSKLVLSKELFPFLSL